MNYYYFFVLLTFLGMRHTVLVKSSAKIKRGDATCYLNSLQDGDFIKLSQKDWHIYLVYRISQSMSQKQIEINEHILYLNGLTNDTTSIIQQFHPRIIDHLKVQVSELDWKIINMNQNKIAESFLEQISIVWHGAKIPIYYDDANYVVLHVQCEGVYRLGINTTVEFIQQGQKEKEIQDESEEQEPHKQYLVLSNEVLQGDMGYLNCIFISHAQKEKLGIQGKFWIVQNRIEFEGVPSIQELLNFEKKQEKQNGKNEITRKKLVLLESKETKGQQSFQCSKQCRKLLGLSQKILISMKQQYKPSIQTLSFEIFLNDQNFTIVIHRLPKTFQNNQSFTEQSQENFCHHVLNILFNKREFFILQQQYPYSFQGSFYVLTLIHKIDSRVKDKFYRLAFIGKESPQKREEFFKKLKNKKMTFFQNNSGTSQSLLLYQRYEILSRWIKIIQENQNSKIEERNLQNQGKVHQIFEAIYKQEIGKIFKFIRSSEFPQSICVIASYGSNGKTFLHEYLSKRQIRMWKVNFRQLNQPSLTFKEIDFYLEWVFANTPYGVIFFDDFDSLCSKIDQGDQLKKRQKAISKLFLRKMARYLKIYRCKLILTARSDSNLDEQLPNHITITLKNPNRELRLRSLTYAAQKSKVDYSPIKKVRLEQEEEFLQKDHSNQKEVQELVDATESMTFGTFIKHAVDLTIPKNKKMTQIYDFTKIAGLKYSKQTIKSIIEKPIKYSFLFKSVPIKLPRGILLYGATGNGKSALGLAVQDEFKMKYFSVKGSDILSKYIGGSEAAVRDIFQKALSVSPSIIFFDEFQSIVPKRSSNNTGVNDRIVNQFLCYLDGVSSISGVYIIAASSRPDLIDPAVLRPGRLDAHLFIDYPGPEERREMIEMFHNSIKIQVGIENIVEMTMNYSYSDLIGLFKQLRIKRSEQVLKMEHFISQDFIKIPKELFYQTLEKFKLSVNPNEQKLQRQIYQNFRDGIGPDIKSQKQIQY